MIKPSVILLGSKPGAVVALETLIARGWPVLAVVPSDQESHAFIHSETLSEAADRLGVPKYSSQQQLSGLRADYVISYMFRHRVLPETLGLAVKAALNFHAGPLPEFGGWAFYNVAILEGVQEYGCTCHHMDSTFDTGPIVRVRKFPVNCEQETAFSLERKTQREMIILWQQILDLLETGESLACEPQDPARMRYMNKATFMALKRIPDDADAETIERIARAFFYPPYDLAYLVHNGHPVAAIPRLANAQLGEWLHQDDLENLRNVSRLHGNGEIQ
ncbi:formyltransferase family protein [Arsukibacterium sp.]|uniref:formyltransferase family protein n=1 Tax=Arsukibacterium sp. TaxID=1977258 RepID=UPI002FD9D88A